MALKRLHYRWWNWPVVPLLFIIFFIFNLLGAFIEVFITMGGLRDDWEFAKDIALGVEEEP